MSTPLPSTTASRAEGIGSLILFVAAALIVGAGLSILAAQCPPRVRLLGLFSVGWGAIYGCLLSQLARRIRCSLNSPALVIIALLTLGGLAGVTWQSFRLETPPVTNNRTHPLAAAMASQIRQSPENVPDEVKQAFQTEAAGPQAPGFHDYLARRVRMLGIWPNPWPEVFWGAELVLGTSAAIAVALRGHRQDASS